MWFWLQSQSLLYSMFGWYTAVAILHHITFCLHFLSISLLLSIPHLSPYYSSYILHISHKPLSKSPIFPPYHYPLNMSYNFSPSLPPVLPTGTLWNLSSYEPLKMVIINHGLQTLTNEVIIPHSGWEHEPNEDSKPRDAEWTTVFKNTSGCLR